MKQAKLFSFPKSRSVVISISQCLGVIFLLLVLVSAWSKRSQMNSAALDQHIVTISEQQLTTVGSAIRLLVVNNLPIEPYLEQVSQQPWLQSVHWYGPTGVLLAKSKQGASINQLYLLGATSEKAEQYMPFITPLFADTLLADNLLSEKLLSESLATEQLLGYVRITLDARYFATPLLTTAKQNMELLWLSLCLATGIGLLVTRLVNSLTGRLLPFKRIFSR